MNKELLTRTECAALRGLAIMGIFLHNYCHWLPGIVRENEYTFKMGNVRVFDYFMAHPDWKIPMHLVSFFGHYGVPIFLFLSAYGLVMKYEKSVTEYLSPARFIGHHYAKLFNMMIVGFALFTIVDAITPGSYHYNVLGIVAQLLMFNNVLPHPNNIIWPGPYWFFGLMLQLYIVYRLLLYKRHWGFTVGLMVICHVIQLCCDPYGDAINRWRYNFIGGMLPFGAGLLYARYGALMTKKLYAIMLPFSLVCIYVCSHEFLNWFFVPLMIVFAGICFVKVLPAVMNKGLAWMGGISAALFVCHPITRKVFFPISRQGDMYTGLLLYIVSSIVLAVVVSLLIKRFPNPKA